MDHAAEQVDIVDIHGTPVAAKPRRDIQKQTDLCHTIFILVTTPDKQVVLSEIPKRDDLPNLYNGLLGATAATLRRHGEDKLQAAERVCDTEIYTNKPPLTEHAEWYQRFDDGSQKYITVYQLADLALDRYNPLDIARLKYMHPAEITGALQTAPDQFSPTFQAIWERCSSALFE